MNPLMAFWAARAMQAAADKKITDEMEEQFEADADS